MLKAEGEDVCLKCRVAELEAMIDSGDEINWLEYRILVARLEDDSA